MNVLKNFFSQWYKYLLWVLVSLFFWGSVIGGPLGMILAIPLSAFIVVIWRLLQRELLG